MKHFIGLLAIFTSNTLNYGINFNTDFLEANVINIFFLLSGLVYVLRKFLGNSLLIRQEKVLNAIQESEERLRQAKIRLAASEKQLAQTQTIINEIQEDAKTTAAKIKQSILAQGLIDIERLTEASKASIVSAESQVREEIQQQIINLAIKKVALKLKNELKPIIQSKIIDNSISQLGGPI